MTNSEILKADVLDILFDKRNKAYGAYLLRKTYPQRMLFSTGITALIATGFFLFIAYQANNQGDVALIEPDVVRLTSLDILEPKLPDKPAVAKEAAPAEQVAAKQFVSTIQIVSNQEIRETDLPPIDALANAAIGTENIEGPAFEGSQQPPNPGPPQNAIVSEPPAAPQLFESSEVGQMAEFPGGAGAFQRYLARHLSQPEGLQPGEVKTVKVQFVIDKDGTISRIVVVQSGGEELDKAVSKVLQRAPRWKPALHNGQAVAVIFTQPVTFVGGEE